MNQVDQELNITRITADVWRQMVADGYTEPVDVPTHGISMWPMLRNGGDGIKIIPPLRPLRVGDVIMFETKNGVTLAHRVCAVDGDRITTQGDNCTKADDVITANQVYGIVSHIRRKNRYIAIDTAFWRFYGRFMMATCPFRMFIKDKFYHPVKIWLYRKLKGHK